MTKKNAEKTLMPRLVANDNGYADHKLAWYDESGRILTGKVPALIQAGGQGLASTQGERKGAYEVGSTQYTCSSEVSNPMRIRNAEYPTSTANRVIFTHALARFGLLGMPVEAAVTLPFRDFYRDDGSINAELRAACAANFAKSDVRVVGCDAQPDIRGVKVYAEALSAWFDWAIDERGELTPGYQEMCDINGKVLVVDIGGSTTDLASVQMVDGELLINHELSGTEKVGVLDAKATLDELVRSHLAKEGVKGATGHGSKLPDALVSNILKNGSASYSGQRWDFTLQRDQACQVVAERVTSYIQSSVGNVHTYLVILVVGGGAIVFKEWLNKILPNAIFLDEFANARGALKFLRDNRNQAAG